MGEPSLGEGDALLAKYDPDGTLLWQRLIGSETRDESKSVATDRFGNVYLASHTLVDIGFAGMRRWDAYLSKFDGDGNLLWQKQQLDIGPFVGDSATTSSVSIDALGNVFLSGTTSQGGSSNATFVRKLDINGHVAWTHRFNLFFDSSVVADGQGNVFLSGTDFGERGRFYSAAIVMKLDGTGKVLWSKLTDSKESDFSADIATDGLGTIYIAGESYESLNGLNPGRPHAFVTKFREIPEPATQVLLLLWGSLLLKRRWHIT